MKKRKITDNIPLKIMSVAIAVVLWLIVVNIDNPTGTNYYTLNDVELINKEYVESSDTIGKMCMPEQNQDSIKVAITATKKIRDKIKVTDISAVADLQQAVSWIQIRLWFLLPLPVLYRGYLPVISSYSSESQCKS